MRISPYAIKPKLPGINVPRRLECVYPSIPCKVAVLIAKMGTLEGKNGIVMADEAMAHGVARGIKAAGGKMVESVEVTTPEKDNSWADIIISMHHMASKHEAPSKKPMWLWVHNPGCSSTIRLREEATNTYQEIFHAGKYLAKRAGFHYLPCGIEDPALFKPSNHPRKWSVSFVANMRLHREAAPLLKRLQTTMRDVFVAGGEWGYAGISSVGPLPFNKVGQILGESKVCLDHISEAHMEEGNSSTRIYQAIACGSPVVSLQRPDMVPEALRPHVHFANGYDEAYNAILRLQSHSIERAKLRPDKANMRGHSCEDRGKEIWQHVARRLNAWS